MTYTIDSAVVGVDPDLTREQWISELAGTPAAGDAGASYDALRQYRVSYRFLRAVFRHESQDGSEGICALYGTRSPGNTRSTRTGVGEVLQVPGRGPFVRYPSWLEGWRDLAWRLVDPGYVYAQRGLTTPATILPVYAPEDDDNDPAAYARAVVAHMNAMGDGVPAPQPGRVVRVALAAGHHNTSGGNGLEIEQTGRLTPAIAAACRTLGMDVRVVTPDEGRGTFPGSLSAGAGRVVEWHNAGWPADLFLEVHTEGNSAGDRGRGAFAIYPDWPSSSDLDVDVRDTLGPDLVRRLTAATGLPARGSGVMSERSTGVGSEGDRLGVFRATVGIRATCTRLIVEYGSHTSPADLRLWSQPGFVDAAARATAEAIAAFYGSGQQPQPTPEPPPARPAWVTDPDARYWPETGQWTQWAFNGRVNELAGLVLLALGYPIGPEARAIVDGVERTVQPFERGWLGYYPEDTPPWHVRHLTVDEVMAILDPAA